LAPLRQDRWGRDDSSADTAGADQIPGAGTVTATAIHAPTTSCASKPARGEPCANIANFEICRFNLPADVSGRGKEHVNFMEIIVADAITSFP
jgi:hypothetical protein